MMRSLLVVVMLVLLTSGHCVSGQATVDDVDQKERFSREQTDYLFEMFDRAESAGQRFYDDHLFYLLFLALNNVWEEPKAGIDQAFLQARVGKVPFLNGGLFETVPPWDVRGAVTLENAVFRFDCDNMPWSGNIMVSDGMRVFRASFAGGCGCDMNILGPNHSMMSQDVCEVEDTDND